MPEETNPASKRPPVDWDTAPTWFIPKFTRRCPTCRSDRHESIRTVQREHGNVEQRFLCFECGNPFKVMQDPSIVLECDDYGQPYLRDGMPAFGSIENPSDTILATGKDSRE